MNDDTVARPVDGQVRPTMEPVAWFRAPYGTLEPNPQFRVTGPQSLEWALPCYTEEQLRLAVIAEREEIAARMRNVCRYISDTLAHGTANERTVARTIMHMLPLHGVISNAKSTSSDAEHSVD